MKTLIEIENAVCEVFGVTPEFFHQKNRGEKKPMYRYVICYVCREINGQNLNFVSIGNFLGVHYSTLNYGIGAINDEIDTNQKFKYQVIEVFKKLGEKTKLVDEREDIKDRIKRILKSYYYLEVTLSISDYDDLIDLIEKL